MEIDKDSKIEERLADPDGMFEAARREWKEFDRLLPDFDCSNKALVRDFYFSFYVLKSNRVSVSGVAHLREPFTVVSKHFYFHHFFWDSAFHALGWMWCNDPTYCRQEISNMPRQQWRNGMIPNECILFADLFGWRSGNTSWCTSPSVHPIAMWEIYKRWQDRQTLELFYDTLLRYDDWMHDYLDIDKDGLSCWRHAWDNGWDDNQRWTSVIRDLQFDPWVESIDQNCLAIRQRELLLMAGEVLGRIDPETRDKLEARIGRTREELESCWDEQDGFFYDRTDPAHEPIRVKTVAGFFPFMTGISGEKRRRLIDHLMSPDEFWTGCPAPCTSADNPTFDPAQTWRGMTWPNINWLLVEALREAGEDEVAGKLLGKFLKAITADGILKCEESYHAITGVGGTALPHLGWGALTIDHVCRHLAGICPKADGTVEFRPLDLGVEWFRLSNVIVGAKSVQVSFDKETGYRTG